MLLIIQFYIKIPVHFLYNVHCHIGIASCLQHTTSRSG